MKKNNTFLILCILAAQACVSHASQSPCAPVSEPAYEQALKDIRCLQAEKGPLTPAMQAKLSAGQSTVANHIHQIIPKYGILDQQSFDNLVSFMKALEASSPEGPTYGQLANDACVQALATLAAQKVAQRGNKNQTSTLNKLDKQ